MSKNEQVVALYLHTLRPRIHEVSQITGLSLREINKIIASPTTQKK